jgi:hypothetical protein
MYHAEDVVESDLGRPEQREQEDEGRTYDGKDDEKDEPPGGGGEEGKTRHGGRRGGRKERRAL